MKTELGLMLPGGKTGVLLLHDIGGSAPELKAHAVALSRAGYTVACPQLSGRASAGMLVSEAEQALSKLKSRCDHVVVMGIAYGAMLALELSRHNAGSIQATILVEPRAWLPALPFTIPASLSGWVKQTWIGSLSTALDRLSPRRSQPSPANRFIPAGATDARPGATELHSIGELLDSVHSGLPAIKQPALLVHRPASVRAGRDGSLVLQRRLGGRVESVMLDDASRGFEQDHGADALAERVRRFIGNTIEEIETRRGNELRRLKTAQGRTSAA